MAALALASCGGSTTQIDPFVAKRFIAFGDDLSVFATGGRKYTTNGLNADKTAIDCSNSQNLLWIQYVTNEYGFGFPECPVGTGEQKALSRATVGAKAADLALQIDAQLAAGGFQEKDLTTVLVGMYDVKELYERYPAEPKNVLLDAATARGEFIAAQVRRLIALGVPVIVATAPSIGYAPYGLLQGADNATLLTDLTSNLNAAVRVNIPNDGRLWGLITADEWLSQAVSSPSSYNLDNVTLPTCNVALPDCTTDTIIAGANYQTWLWADSLRIGVRAHSGFGQIARNLASRLPF
jgi:outer membrane lipase/esterase